MGQTNSPRNQNGTPHRSSYAWARALLLVSSALAGALTIRSKLRRHRLQHNAPQQRLSQRPIVPNTHQSSALPQSAGFSPGRAHQTSDLDVPVLAVVLVLLLLGACVVHTALWGLVKSRGPVAIDAATRWQVIPPGGSEAEPGFPQLQLSPQHDLREFESREQQELHPSNSTPGRIPIERAMALVAEQGVPKWQTNSEPKRPASPLELQHRRAEEASADSE